MSEEEKYDELIRQKFAEKEFMFNEANWEKAEAMIDSSRKTKKIFWWSGVFLIGLITGIFLMFPLIKNNSSQINTNHTKLNNALTDTDSLADKLQSAKTITDEKPATGNELSATDALKTPGTFTVETKEKMAEMKNGTNNSKTADESSRETNENQSTKNNSNNAASSHQLRKNKYSNPYGEEYKNAQHADLTTGQLTSQKKKKENNASGNEGKVLSLLHDRNVIKNAKPHLTKKSEDVKTEIKEKNEEHKEDGIKNELAKKGASSTDIADSTFLENKPAEKIDAKIGALNDSTKQEEKKLAAADSVQKSDSTKAVAQDKTITPALDGLANATFLSVDAGINGQLGWKNNAVMEARGITPVIGLGITHAFNQTWSFYTGIHYNGIGYLKGDSKTSSATTYDFGSTTTITATKPRFLHYLSVPLAIQYHFNDKNAILAGGSLSYLLNAKSKVEESITSVRPIDSLSVVQNSSSDHYAKTFNIIDAAVSIGYRRKISAHFSIAAIANFGLLDIKPNSFFLQNTFERNSGLKVILSYNLFDF